MLRIGNFYESRLGRNDGNPLYVQACLKRMQYYVDHWAGKAPNPELLKWFVNGEDDKNAMASAKTLWERTGDLLEVDHFYPNGDIAPFGKYDLNLHIDWGEDGLTGLLPYVPIDTPHPMAYWASDTHIHDASYQHRLKTARKADFVFVAQKRGLMDFVKDGIKNPIWLPHAVEPQAYPRFDLLSKKFDVCFVGHVNSSNREEALDRLFNEFPNFYYGQALFDDAARKYAESKVCFNIAMTDDINMRNFEVMATGSFLLTSYLPEFADLGLIDGKHLVLYKDMDECIEKAKYYIANDDKREEIAQAGYAEVIKNHTIQNRVDLILNTFLTKSQQEEVHASIQAR